MLLATTCLFAWESHLLFVVVVVVVVTCRDYLLWVGGPWKFKSKMNLGRGSHGSLHIITRGYPFTGQRNEVRSPFAGYCHSKPTGRGAYS